MFSQSFSKVFFLFFFLGSLLARGLADQVLTTTSFSSCLANANVSVQNLDITYDNALKTVTFNVAGTSTVTQNVTAVLNVLAYGISVYNNTFNPCSQLTFVAQLCPVPAGSFSATGVQTISPGDASSIPAIAFSIPDIDAQATLQLKSLDTGEDIACVSSSVTNGKTVNVPAVPYIAAGIAAGALVMTGVTALGAAAAGGSVGGAGTLSPSFTQVAGWFQGMAMNGMMSVNYPPIYRSFSKNFAFSTGLIPWQQMQISIDNFRNSTGGNLTGDSVEFLKNTNLTFTDGSKSSLTRRAINLAGYLVGRDSLSTNITSAPATTNSTNNPVLVSKVSGIKAYAEQLSVPQANTFMTVFLVVAIVIAAIIIGVLLLKAVLEGWALLASFPKSLAGFREHYWGTMARTIVNLILVLYGVWVLYCVFQFTNGDSWAAKLIAGVTLAIFTGVLAFFTFKIWQTARRLKQTEGDSNGLYDNKEHWLKYSLFYDSFKKGYWWLFVPQIIYMFAKGCILAGADGHGLTQTIAQGIIEILMLIVLIWSRPYERRSGNVLNIFIQVVRVLSVVCILVFVEELGVAQTTQTITGVVLIVVQSVLTVILAILIGVNALISLCKENPHRKRRKEAEKLNREFDNLTPLDARNSLLVERTGTQSTTQYMYDAKPQWPQGPRSFTPTPSQQTHFRSASNGTQPAHYRSASNGTQHSAENLVGGAAPMASTGVNFHRGVGY